MDLRAACAEHRRRRAPASPTGSLRELRGVGENGMNAPRLRWPQSQEEVDQMPYAPGHHRGRRCDAAQARRKVPFLSGLPRWDGGPLWLGRIPGDPPK